MHITVTFGARPYSLMASKWEFKAPWYGLYDNVSLLHAAFLEYVEGAGY